MPIDMVTLPAIERGRLNELAQSVMAAIDYAETLKRPRMKADLAELPAAIQAAGRPSSEGERPPVVIAGCRLLLWEQLAIVEALRLAVEFASDENGRSNSEHLLRLLGEVVDSDADPDTGPTLMLEKEARRGPS